MRGDEQAVVGVVKVTEPTKLVFPNSWLDQHDKPCFRYLIRRSGYLTHHSHTQVVYADLGRASFPPSDLFGFSDSWFIILPTASEIQGTLSYPQLPLPWLEGP